MYLKMVDEFEKELIARGLKIRPELHDARFDFALWLEKKSVNSAQSDSACTCAEPYRHPYREDWCTRCGGTVHMSHLKGNKK